MPSVYLAGPITGLSYDQTTSWRQHIIDNVDPRIKCFSPMRAKAYLTNEEKILHAYENTLLSTARGIFARDIWDCYHRDSILVNFLGATQVSIGTIIEITTFWHLRKPIVIIMEEDNIHKHAMLEEMCPFRVESLISGIGLLEKILLPVDH